MTRVSIVTSMLAAMGLFAEGNASPDALAGWGNLTALGIVAVVLIYLVTHILPKWYSQLIAQQKSHVESLRESQESFSASLKEERDTHKTEIASIVGEVKASRDAVLEIVRRCEARRNPTQPAG